MRLRYCPKSAQIANLVYLLFEDRKIESRRELKRLRHGLRILINQTEFYELVIYIYIYVKDIHPTLVTPYPDKKSYNPAPSITQSYQ